MLQFTDPDPAPKDGIKAQVWLAFSSGSAAGKVMKGKFDERVSGGEAPETQNVFLGFGKPDSVKAATAPETPDAVMAGSGMTAYVLSKCMPGRPNCQFSPQAWAELSNHLELQQQVATTPSAVGVQYRRLEGADKCNAHSTCTSCVADLSCGWCSQPVTYVDGSPGAQCAGKH